MIKALTVECRLKWKLQLTAIRYDTGKKETALCMEDCLGYLIAPVRKWVLY